MCHKKNPFQNIFMEYIYIFKLLYIITTIDKLIMFVNVIICYLQVCATEECREPPSEVAPPVRTDGLNNELAAHLSSVAFKLALTEEEHTVTNSSFHTHQLEGSNGGNVLFNDTLNTFYLWLYSVKHGKGPFI